MSIRKSMQKMKTILIVFGGVSIALLFLGELAKHVNHFNEAGDVNYILKIYVVTGPYFLTLGKLILSATIVALVVESVMSKHKMEAISAEAEERRNQFNEIMESQKQLLAQRELQFSRMLAQNGKTVLQSVYKRLIPEAAFKEVENILLNQRLERTNYRIEITLDELEQEQAGDDVDASLYFHMSMHSSYRLKNLTDKDYETMVTFGIEVPNEEKLSDITSVSSMKIGGEEFIERGDIEIRQGKHACEVSVKVKVPASGFLDVAMQGVTVKRRIDSEMWASLIPSDGLVISIMAPKGVDIECKSIHSKPLKLLEGCTNSNRKTFHLNYGIIPFQSILAWWNGEKG